MNTALIDLITTATNHPGAHTLITALATLAGRDLIAHYAPKLRNLTLTVTIKTPAGSEVSITRTGTPETAETPTEGDNSPEGE